MDIFSEITSEEWDDAVRQSGRGSVFMQSGWEQAVSDALSYVAYQYYRYRGSHVVRVAHVNGRSTTAPFTDGSDVVSIGETALDLSKFQADAKVQFGEGTRLRINERFAATENNEDSTVIAYEYVVALGEPLLPRVRKTLRHILNEHTPGEVKVSREEKDINAAYRLYVRHMRSVRNFAMPEQLFASLLKENGGELWTWSKNNRPEAMAVFIPTGSEVLYSLSAASSEGVAQHAAHHLVYQALESYKEQGQGHASLGSTGAGSALEVFKRGWRGEQFAIYELGERSGVSRTSRVRGLVRYVPLVFYPALTNILGKRFF